MLHTVCFFFLTTEDAKNYGRYKKKQQIFCVMKILEYHRIIQVEFIFLQECVEDVVFRLFLHGKSLNPLGKKVI